MSVSGSRRIARNALARLTGEIIGKLASLVFFVTMARELGREGFGAFMFALGLTGALVLCAGFGTDDLTAREVARDRSRAGRFLADVISLKLATCTVLLLGAVLAVSIGNFSPHTLPAVALVGAGVAIEALSRTWYSVFQAYERLDLMSLSVITQRTSTAIVGVLLLKLGFGVVIAALVFALGAVLGFAMALWSGRRLGISADRADPGRWRALLSAGLPIGIAGLLYILLLRVDVTLLSFLSGEAEVGIYSAAYRLVESTQFLAWAISAAMLPWLARAQRLEAGAAGLVRGYELGLKAMNVVLLPIGLVFVLFAGPLIDLLYGHAFQGSVLPLQLLGLTSALYGIQNFAITTFIARDSPGTFARIVGVVVVVNLVGNGFAIPRWGADGAAATALASGALLAGVSVFLARRRIGHVRHLRVFLGPVAGALAMILCVWLIGDSLFVALPLAGLAYLLALGAVELIAWRQDVDVYLEVLPARLRDRLVTPRA
jgi:O-antigen/teichoic acid export membrane protein